MYNGVNGDEQMKISKTKFFNYIRCQRYVALEELTLERERAVISFDESLEDLYTEELKSKKQDLLLNLYDKLNFSDSDFEDDNDFDPLHHKEDVQLVDLLQDQYEQIETLSAEKIKSLYGGHVTYSRDTYKQKYIEKEIDGFLFFAFIDAFQEDDQTIRIIETKASTSRKFDQLGYTDNKVFFSIFHQDEKGIYRLKKELGMDVNDDKYEKQIKKMMDKYDGVGRYIYDIAYQRYIHEHSGSSRKRHEYYLAVLNHNYIYDGHKHPDGSCYYNPNDIIRIIDVTEITKKLLPIIDNEVKQIIFRLNNMQATPVPLGIHCQKDKGVRECPFINVCMNDKKVPAKNSLFAYRNSHRPFVENRGSKNKKEYHLYDLINEGIVHVLEIDRNWLSPIQKVQYDTFSTSIPFIDHKRIKACVDQLKYPLYHLDFESFASPLPRYVGEKPYQQSLFQFSLHIEHKNKKIDKDDNVYYLTEDHDDHREDLVKKMIEYIPMNQGTVIVYNKGFESGRIKELIELFPKYQNELKNIQNRIFDLQYLVKGNQDFYKKLGFSKDVYELPVYYHEDFQRSFSIKKVLPVLVPELDYNNLDEVRNGQEAQIAYFKMPDMNKDEREKTYRNMLEYCKQDTWAMVKILEALSK